MRTLTLSRPVDFVFVTGTDEEQDLPHILLRLTMRKKKMKRTTMNWS